MEIRKGNTDGQYKLRQKRELFYEVFTVSRPLHHPFNLGVQYEL
jgi:hypothetical protein